MDAAIEAAYAALGSTWPNPAVGCVLVDAQGRWIATAATRPGGRPHAETEALRLAGERARGATAYVTLEPCAHHGKTPPCADALVAAEVARVVIAVLDEDPRVAGAGVRKLESAGIAVEVGRRADEATKIVEGFFFRLRTGLPLHLLASDPRTSDAIVARVDGAFVAVLAHARDGEDVIMVQANDSNEVLLELGTRGLTSVRFDDEDVTPTLDGREGLGVTSSTRRS